MKLSILTWNINFMHDHWLERVESINSTLEKHINNTDIIALQEATLPFSNGIDDIYKFLKCKKINYTTGPEFFFEKDFIYKKIRDVCPKYEKIIKNVFWGRGNNRRGCVEMLFPRGLLNLTLSLNQGYLGPC